MRNLPLSRHGLYRVPASSSSQSRWSSSSVVACCSSRSAHRCTTCRAAATRVGRLIGALLRLALRCHSASKDDSSAASRAWRTYSDSSSRGAAPSARWHKISDKGLCWSANGKVYASRKDEVWFKGRRWRACSTLRLQWQGQGCLSPNSASTSVGKTCPECTFGRDKHGHGASDLSSMFVPNEDQLSIFSADGRCLASLSATQEKT